MSDEKPTSGVQKYANPMRVCINDSGTIYDSPIGTHAILPWNALTALETEAGNLEAELTALRKVCDTLEAERDELREENERLRAEIKTCGGPVHIVAASKLAEESK